MKSKINVPDGAVRASKIADYVFTCERSGRLTGGGKG